MANLFIILLYLYWSYCHSIYTLQLHITTMFYFYAQGVPDAQAQELINEEVELCVEEKGPLIRWNWKSKFIPMDMTFKLNEETDVYDPMLKETTKNVATKAGNVLDIITVSSQGTWHTKCTVGHTFMVFVSIIMHLTLVFLFIVILLMGSVCISF